MAHIDINQYATSKKDSIYTTEIKLRPEIRNKIIETIKEGDKQGYTSNVKACMTEWNMQDKPGFKELEEEIGGIVRYITEVMYNSVTATPHNIAIGNMWGLLYTKGDSAKVHAHWPAVWSGVFYLDIPKDDAGALKFPDLDHAVEPETGELVIFSGSTKHGVDTIKSSGERLAVSFNYDVIDPENLHGLIGNRGTTFNGGIPEENTGRMFI